MAAGIRVKSQQEHKNLTYLVTVSDMHSHSYDNIRTIINELYKQNVFILACVYTSYPHHHAHLIVRGYINYANLHKANKCKIEIDIRILKTQLDVKRAIKYIANHHGNFVNHINREGNKIKEVNKMEEETNEKEKLLQRIKELEEEIRKLKAEKEDRKPIKRKAVDVRMTAMTVRVIEAKKGVGMFIRFARFVKQTKYGAYYVAMTKQEAQEFIDAIKEIMRSGEERKVKIRIENGEEKALEGANNNVR